MSLLFLEHGHTGRREDQLVRVLRVPYGGGKPITRRGRSTDLLLEIPIGDGVTSSFRALHSVELNR
jgi:hypothetical protein